MLTHNFDKKKYPGKSMTEKRIASQDQGNTCQKGPLELN